MKRTLVQYKTKADRTAENERLVKQVFQELHAKSPKGVRYMALTLDDGTFVYFVATETPAPIQSLSLRLSGRFRARSRSVALSRRSPVT